MIDSRKLLEQASFFQELSAASKNAIASICQIREFKKKSILFTEGTRGDAVFLLATGNIRLSRMAPGGHESVIKIIQPGEFFAEVILFERNHYPVTATATSSGTVLSIPRREIHQLLSTSEFRNDFIAMLMKKQRYLTDRIYFLTSCDLEERFVTFLDEHYGRKGHVQITFAKKDIAAGIGSTPEALSRLILRLKKRKVLTWKGRTITFRPGFWTERPDVSAR